VRANRRRITKPVNVGEYNYQQVKLLAGQGSIYLKTKDGFDCVLVEEDPEDIVLLILRKKVKLHDLSLSLLPFAFIKGTPTLPSPRKIGDLTFLDTDAAPPINRHN
jgi:hypothetical protein